MAKILRLFETEFVLQRLTRENVFSKGCEKNAELWVVLLWGEECQNMEWGKMFRVLKRLNNPHISTIGRRVKAKSVPQFVFLVLNPSSHPRFIQSTSAVRLRQTST